MPVDHRAHQRDSARDLRGGILVDGQVDHVVQQGLPDAVGQFMDDGDGAARHACRHVG